MDNKNIKMQEQPQTQADFENAAVSQSETDDAIESPLHKMLKRDIEAEALKRLEESAVSDDDFHEVIKQWNRLDSNRERKERYHEIYRNDEDFPLELGAAIGTNFATNIHMLRQAFKGNFLEIIYNSPYEIQEHITEKYLFEILRDLKPDYKELLYYSILVYDGIAPTYHIALKEDKPVLVWDFYSLSNVIRLMFSTSLTDEKNPLRLCKHCQEVYIASRPNAVFCSTQCKNRYNVYKTRKKNKN